MKFNYPILIVISFLIQSKQSAAQPDLKKYDVVWDSQSQNASGSMPIGNGDIGTNLWVNKNGDLTLLMSKTDAYSEIGRLLKIGQICIKTIPNLLDGSDFTQRLNLANGQIEINSKKGSNQISIRCRVDANSPMIFVEGESNIPIRIEVINQIWRTEEMPLTGKERHSAYGIAFGEKIYPKEKDTIFQQPDVLLWCHQNKSSIWQTTLDNQNISEFNTRSKDPLLYQNFGAMVGGNHFKSSSANQLETIEPTKKFNLNIAVLKSQTQNPEVWKNKINLLYHQHADKKITQEKYNLHKAWWTDFWGRHYIVVSAVSDSVNAFKITQGYILQRYMNACAGRGSLPIKFNGSIFTVNLTENVGNGLKGFDADYRDWGGNYWFQNTRLPYWSMLYSGDFGQMKPLFDMYINALDLARFRTQNISS